MVAVVRSVEGQTDSELFEVAAAVAASGFFPGQGQCGQEHGGQDCDDRNDHQQLDERKGLMTPRMACSGEGDAGLFLHRFL